MIRRRSGRVISIGSVVGVTGNCRSGQLCRRKGGADRNDDEPGQGKFARRNITVQLHRTRLCGDADDRRVWTKHGTPAAIADVPASRFGKPPEIARGCLCFWPATRPPTLRGQDASHKWGAAIMSRLGKHLWMGATLFSAVSTRYQPGIGALAQGVNTPWRRSIGKRRRSAHARKIARDVRFLVFLGRHFR